MSSSIKRYRRVSVTQADGREGKYDARVDIDVDSETGIVIYRVHSQVLTKKHVPVRSSGNAADDAERLEQACQQVYDFDQGYRVRAWPKPQKSASAAAPKAAQPTCERCGDLGFIEDETGYPMVCSCRGGHADH